MRVIQSIVSLLATMLLSAPAKSQVEGPWAFAIQEKSVDCGPLPELITANAEGQLILPWSNFVNSRPLVTCEIKGLLLPLDAQNAAFTLNFALQGQIGKGPMAAPSPGADGAAPQDNLSVWLKLEGGGEPSRSPEFTKRVFNRFRSTKDLGAWTTAKHELAEPICPFQGQAIPLRIVLKTLAQPRALRTLQIESLTLGLQDGAKADCQSLP